MTPRFPLAAALLLALPCLAAGCASSEAPPPGAVSQVALEPAATGPVDGIYKGSVHLVSATGDGCPGDARGLIEIGDRRLLYPYAPSLIFVAPIRTDGKIHAETGGYSLDGTLAGGALDVVVAGAGCRTELSFGRVAYF